MPYEVSIIFLIDKAENKKEAISLAKAELQLGNYDFNVEKISEKEFAENYTKG